VAYWERLTSTPGVVLWGRDVPSEDQRSLILPDGCMDLIWDGRRIFVAGPDSSARWHVSAAGSRYVALRFSRGVGAQLLDVAADEVVDCTPDAVDVLGGRAARALSADLEEDPTRTMVRWLKDRRESRGVAALGFQIYQLAASGLPITDVAGQVGYSERQLRRRCETLFGYGPRRLGRILRLNQALDTARTGRPWAAVAAECRYADQAHLSREIKELTGLAPTALLAALPA
jgi:AraC-like DNA-binding protein